MQVMPGVYKVNVWHQSISLLMVYYHARARGASPPLSENQWSKYSIPTCFYCDDNVNICRRLPEFNSVLLQTSIIILHVVFITFLFILG